MKEIILHSLKKAAAPLMGKGYWKAPILRSIAGWFQKSYKPEYILLEGNRFYLNYNDGYFSSYLAVHGYWEKLETELIRTYVKPGMSVLDLGANIGYYTVLMSSLVGERGSVLAFEPEQICFEFLKRNTHQLENVRISQKAAWDGEEKIPFYVNPNDAMDHTAISIRAHNPSQIIEAVDVDSYVGDQSFDFVKMDIQGAEGRALQGMRRTFERKLPKCLITEFWPDALDKAGTDPIEFYRQLEAFGYDIRIINEEREELLPAGLKRTMEECSGDRQFTNLLCASK